MEELCIVSQNIVIHQLRIQSRGCTSLVDDLLEETLICSISLWWTWCWSVSIYTSFVLLRAFCPSSLPMTSHVCILLQQRLFWLPAAMLNNLVFISCSIFSYPLIRIINRIYIAIIMPQLWCLDIYYHASVCRYPLLCFNNIQVFICRHDLLGSANGASCHCCACWVAHT